MRIAVFLLGLGVAMSAGLPFASASTSPFRSGAYKAVVTNAGIVYHSTWTLMVSAGRVTGTSTWTCCPGKRTDPLSGTVNGNRVVIRRDCSKQGYVGPCSQTYTGTVNAKGVASGTWAGTGAVSGSTFSLTRA